MALRRWWSVLLSSRYGQQSRLDQVAYRCRSSKRLFDTSIPDRTKCTVSKDSAIVGTRSSDSYTWDYRRSTRQRDPRTLDANERARYQRKVSPNPHHSGKRVSGTRFLSASYRGMYQGTP